VLRATFPPSRCAGCDRALTATDQPVEGRFPLPARERLLLIRFRLCARCLAGPEISLIGTQTVTGIQRVVDSGWFSADNEQTVLVDSVTINGTTFTFEEAAPGAGPTSKDDCKNRG
jgi:hypothetical protein